MPHERVGLTLQVFGAFGFLLFAAISVAIAYSERNERDTADSVLPAMVCLAIGPLLIVYLGAAIKRHRARAAGIVVGLFMSLAFPVGTIVGGYIIWNLVKNWNVAESRNAQETFQ
jgi:MFS family permease